MGIWGPETGTPYPDIASEFIQSLNSTPRQSYRQLKPPFLWVHITGQNRKCLLDRWRLEPPWDSWGREGNWLQASRPEDNSLWMSVTYCLLDAKQQRDIKHFCIPTGFKRMQAPLLQKRNPRDRKAGPPSGAAETSPGQERPLQSPSIIVEKAHSSFSSH